MPKEKDQERNIREELTKVVEKFLLKAVEDGRMTASSAMVCGMSLELAEAAMDTLMVGEPARSAPYEQMKWAIVNKRLKVGAKE